MAPRHWDPNTRTPIKSNEFANTFHQLQFNVDSHQHTQAAPALGRGRARPGTHPTTPDPRRPAAHLAVASAPQPRTSRATRYTSDTPSTPAPHVPPRGPVARADRRNPRGTGELPGGPFNPPAFVSAVPTRRGSRERERPRVLVTLRQFLPHGAVNIRPFRRFDTRTKEVHVASNETRTAGAMPHYAAAVVTF